jgi:hypothetical protein
MGIFAAFVCACYREAKNRGKRENQKFRNLLSRKALSSAPFRTLGFFYAV